MKKESYIYISARIRSLENQLLNRTDMERMIDAKDAQEAFGVLNSTDYADNLLNVEVENYSRALDNDWQQVRELFSRYLPEKALLRWLFLEHDFHNLKLLFKIKYSEEEDLETYLSPFGKEPVSDLKQCILRPEEIEKKSLLNVSEDILEIAEKTKKALQKNPQPFYIDALLDKEYFRLISRIAEKIKNRFISSLNRKLIDIANIRIFLRTLSLEKPKEFIGDLLIDGGEIPEKEFLRFYGEDLASALKHFSHYFPKSVEKIFSIYLKEKNFPELEKGIEDFQSELFRKSKYISYGPEVVISYWWAKKIAIKNIQLIMDGKLNSISAEEIRKRVSYY